MTNIRFDPLILASGIGPDVKSTNQLQHSYESFVAITATKCGCINDTNEDELVFQAATSYNTFVSTIQ